jgi:DNA-binding MarR family transcriptional regulator
VTLEPNRDHDMEATTTRTTGIYDPKSFEPQRSVGRLFGRVKMAMGEALDRELAPFDITSAQFVILVSLATGEADSAAGLCRGISYDPGAMTRMIDRLEQKGLIRRAQLPDDRRKVGLELTPEGKAVYPKLRAASAAVQNRFLRGFTRSEVRQLELFLQRMLSNS